MSDLQIELQEALLEYARLVRLEQETWRGHAQVNHTLSLEYYDPRYRVDACVKEVAKHRLPLLTRVYSNN